MGPGDRVSDYSQPFHRVGRQGKAGRGLVGVALGVGVVETRGPPEGCGGVIQEMDRTPIGQEGAGEAEKDDTELGRSGRRFRKDPARDRIVVEGGCEDGRQHAGILLPGVAHIRHGSEGTRGGGMGEREVPPRP
jgi:hypothetical protein